jgi:hypothetical protein
MLKLQAAASATITSSVVRMTTVLARSLGILVASSYWNGHTKAMANMENAKGAKTDRAKYKAAAAKMMAHKLSMVWPVAVPPNMRTRPTAVAARSVSRLTQRPMRESRLGAGAARLPAAGRDLGAAPRRARSIRRSGVVRLMRSYGRARRLSAGKTHGWAGNRSSRQRHSLLHDDVDFLMSFLHLR